MISVDNRGFWAFGRDRAPVATFKEGRAPKLTPSYPPRLVEGSKTPIGRAGTRSAEENIRGPPTNEYGKVIARTDELEPPKKRYNKGQLGRLTPGFSIPPPVPWTFEAANKALDGVDAKDAIVEDLMRAPLTPQGYIDLLKDLIKAERDATQRDVLRAWRDELTRLAATTDTYERQGRMPDAAIGRRRDELHDEVDRWVVANPRAAPAAAPALPPPAPIPRPIGAPAAAPALPPALVGLIPAVATIPRPIGAPPIPVDLPVSMAAPTVASSVPRIVDPMQWPSSLARPPAAPLPPEEEKKSFESPPPTDEEIMAIATKGRGKKKLVQLKNIIRRFGLNVNLQGKKGRTAEVIGKEIIRELNRLRAERQVQWD